VQLTTTNRQGFAPATFSEARQFSEELATSSLVPKAYQNKPLDILVAMQWGQELGLAPMQALQNIAVINGKPSVYGDAMMALVQASPVCEGIDEHIENEGTPNPVAVCVAKRKGRNPVIARFSVEDAVRAGLWKKAGPWTQYPKRMLQMRARGFALRDAFPDVLKGLITAEEAEDYPEEKDISPVKPANPLDAIAPPAIRAPLMVEVDMVAGEVIEPEPIESDLQNVPAESAEPAAEPAVVGDWPLMVPGKDQPFSVHQTQQEWQDAYEALADKTARAGKRPARERMTIVKQLRDVNQDQLSRIDPLARMTHTAAYSGRIKALGALVPPEEK
jgi:hypothetical protein